jgi:hypothetical protein
MNTITITPEMGAKNNMISAMFALIQNPTAETQDALTTSAAYFRFVKSGKQIANIPPFGWDTPQNHGGDWYEIRAEFDRVLTTEEAMQASGAIGYALRENMAGEDLSFPTIELFSAGKTVLSYGYDSTKSRRDDYYACEAFEAAATYIVEGSPVRKTNRAGRGTAGTRLVEGIGPVGVTFYVK